MSDKRLDCSHCTNHMTFGGASPGMIRQMGGMKAVMETMASQSGWTREPSGWKCGYCHRREANG